VDAYVDAYAYVDVVLDVVAVAVVCLYD